MKISVYRVIRFLLKILLNRLNKTKIITPYLLCRLENLSARIIGSKTSFKYDKIEKSFIAKDSRNKRYFLNKERGFKLYRRGIEERGKFIFSSYCMHNIKFEDGDVIVDCGANLGDLSIELEKIPQRINYIGLEPAPQDFLSLKKNINLDNAIVLNKALGEENSILKLYVSSEKGDSSLIKPKKYSEIIDVEVLRLDSLCDDLGIDKIKFLKVEAEGYEPEILNGAKRVLRNVDYIAVDGGYERGSDLEQTFTRITNFLLDNNFELVDIFFPWHRALFKRKS